MNDSTAVQLTLIGEVSQMLSQAHIPHWLFGGWSVDFHVGSVTREHGDIEFFIWGGEGPCAADMVEAAGYELVDHPHPEEASIWRKHGQIVELYYLAVNAGGKVVGRGRWDRWPLHPNSLRDESREVEGVQCPVVSIECILNLKVEYAQQTGVPPREKDWADVMALRRALIGR